jgi:hypothetical protein
VTNEERRVALAMARRKALEHAEIAETQDDEALTTEMQLAVMWANVASAMKVGQALEADGVIETEFHSPDGHAITR